MAKKSTRKLVVKKSAPTPVVKKDGPKKEVSKMDLCCGYMEDHEGLTRGELMKVFQEKFGLTKAGSSTYVQLLKVKLNYKTAPRTKKEKEKKAA